MRRRLFLALCAPAACGQTFLPVPQTDQSLFHTSANLAQIDALVTDSQGRPVRNLTAADFEVLRKGEPQKILGVSFVQKPRTLVLVVDDLGLSVEGINRVRAALVQFVDQQMRPGDRAAIVRTGSGTGAQQQFTSDKDELHAAIGMVQCNPARVPGGTDDQAVKDDQATKDDQTTGERLSAGSRGALRFAIDGLRLVPGRKAVVLFSGNSDLFRNAVEPLARLVDLANQAAAVLYVVVSRNAAAPEADAALAVLAEQTGGALLANPSAVSSVLEQVLREQDGYYLIGWQFTGFLMGWDDRKLNVKTTREGLTVRSRSNFIGITEFPDDDTQQTRREELMQALSRPFSPANLRVRLTALFSNSASRGSYVEALLHIDAKDLSRIRSADGLHRFGLDTIIQMYDENGRADQESNRSLFLTLTESDYQHALERRLGVLRECAGEPRRRLPDARHRG